MDHIIACAVLHNFLLLEGNEYQVGFKPINNLLYSLMQWNYVLHFVQEYARNEEINLVPWNITNAQLLNAAKADGILKRDYIASHLYPDED